jgi:hypothetical protein
MFIGVKPDFTRGNQLQCKHILPVFNHIGMITMPPFGQYGKAILDTGFSHIQLQTGFFYEFTHSGLPGRLINFKTAGDGLPESLCPVSV